MAWPLRAPTWSWASMKGSILPRSRFESDVALVEIKDIQLKTTGDARNGQVEIGFLTFECLLLELARIGETYVQNASSWNFGVVVDLDDRTADGLPRNEKQYTKVLGLPIILSRSAESISIHGLVIELAPGGYPVGYFVRIGTFFFVLQLKEDRPSIEDIRDELKEQEKRTIVLA
jgi:hypothetical protein